MVPGTEVDDAAYRGYLLGFGDVVASWFDDETLGVVPTTHHKDPNIQTAIQAADYKACIEYVHEMIRKEIKRGILPGNIFLAGHSQGGWVASTAAYSFPDAFLGGLILCSSTPWTQVIAAVMVPLQKKLPTLGFHCPQDMIIPHSLAQEKFARLNAIGCNCELQAVSDCTLLNSAGPGYHDAMTGQMQEPFVNFVTRATIVGPIGQDASKTDASEADAAPASDSADVEAKASRALASTPATATADTPAAETPAAPATAEPESATPAYTDPDMTLR
jgi:phospholipase/carboxylesterase